MPLKCNVGTCTKDQKFTHTQVHLLTSCLLIQNYTFLTSFSKIRFENLHLSFSYACTFMHKEARSEVYVLFGEIILMKLKS